MKTLKEALIGKHNIDNFDIDIFNKKSLKNGTIVMFRDETFGVYVEGDLAQNLKKEFSWDNAEDKWFFSYAGGKHNNCYFDLSQLNDELYDHHGHRDYDVIRIYDRKLKENEIGKMVNNFYVGINHITSTMNYKERK